MFDLILTPLVAGLVIVTIHAYFGLHVIARGVIFVDLAFAQIAALGTTLGLILGMDHGSLGSLGMGIGATMSGALIFSFSRLRGSLVPQEAIIGITYVVASAAVILLSSFSADGAEHVAETLTGTLIWVGWPEVIRMAVVYAVLGVIHYVFRKPMLGTSFAPESVERPRTWDFIFYLTFGLAIAFSVPIAGVLVVFSTLVIPAAVAFLLTDVFSKALLIAWVSGSVALVAGIGASFAWDVTTGPLVVVTFGAVLVIGLIVRSLIGSPQAERVRL